MHVDQDRPARREPGVQESRRLGHGAHGLDGRQARGDVIGVAEGPVRSEGDDDVGIEEIDGRARRLCDVLQRLLGKVAVAQVQAGDVVHSQRRGRVLQLLDPDRPEDPPRRGRRLADLARLALGEGHDRRDRAGLGAARDRAADAEDLVVGMREQPEDARRSATRDRWPPHGRQLAEARIRLPGDRPLRLGPWHSQPVLRSFLLVAPAGAPMVRRMGLLCVDAVLGTVPAVSRGDLTARGWQAEEGTGGDPPWPQQRRPSRRRSPPRRTSRTTASTAPRRRACSRPSAAGRASRCRIHRNGEFALYTVSELLHETTDSVVRMGPGGRQRLQSEEEFEGVLDTKVVDPDLCDKDARDAGELVERLADDGIPNAPHRHRPPRRRHRGAHRPAKPSGWPSASARSWPARGGARAGGRAAAPSSAGTSPPRTSTRSASLCSTR